MRALLKIRLSWFFFGFLAIFTLLVYKLPSVTFSSGALTLFSVNSFLYGFYISPVLSGQKQRIDDLNRTIRAEANALFSILLLTKKLPRRSRNIIQSLCEDYMEASSKERRPAEGEIEYQQLISYCLEYDGKAPELIEKILNGLVANQQNRSQLAMQLGNKVFSNEWWIMLVLFGITLGFVLFLAVPGGVVMHLVKALLCTGLSMLMINLVKFSTLTHKKAKNIWDPLDHLKTSRFRQID
ncbi:MAG TPA: hypothetical protein VLF91_04990 [Candidatus Saccharimonadales bacterium]|nr:hypothetical protein [Candidatus Saccharimonadales bacterium]